MTALEPAKDTSPLTKAAARKLTDRIAMATGMLWQMIAEAHDREAWRALGYDTWAAYVAVEFEISRGHAFRLLDQARVTAALEAATGEPVAVSARQAAVLRHDPAKAAKRAAKAIGKGVEPKEAVAREVERVRSRQTTTSKQGNGEGGDPTGTPTQPGARGGAVAATEKAAEAPTAAPQPTRSGTPQRGEDPAPPAPSPAGGPATADGVRHMIAMVTTTGADTIAHCCTDKAIAAAIGTLRTALAKASKPVAAPAQPLARKTVTPIPKTGRR